VNKQQLKQETNTMGFIIMSTLITAVVIAMGIVAGAMKQGL